MKQVRPYIEGATLAAFYLDFDLRPIDAPVSMCEMFWIEGVPLNIVFLSHYPILHSEHNEREAREWVMTFLN